jgi:hypothetical protein
MHFELRMPLDVKCELEETILYVTYKLYSEPCGARGHVHRQRAGA